MSEDPEINQSSKAVQVRKNKSTSHRSGLTGANKKMLHLLRKAKVQLMKIDQQKQLKSSQVMSINTFFFYLKRKKKLGSGSANKRQTDFLNLVL